MISKWRPCRACRVPFVHDLGERFLLMGHKRVSCGPCYPTDVPPAPPVHVRVWLQNPNTLRAVGDLGHVTAGLVVVSPFLLTGFVHRGVDG